MVRCPVCESPTVTVVLNSKPHASCACCDATWIQEGSWQRQIRPAPIAVPVNGNVDVSSDVIRLPEPRAFDDPEEEAVAT